MRIARSTVLASLRQGDGRTSLTMADIAARNEKQTALNLICGEGCGTCSGLNPIHASEFRCPLFEAGVVEKLSDAEKAEAATCNVPALYAAVDAGETAPDAVTADTIQASCPFLEVTG